MSKNEYNCGQKIKYMDTNVIMECHCNNWAFNDLFFCDRMIV